jgi:hypothetical protein
MPGGDVECEKVQGYWNMELVVCSHELRRVEETSEGVQESLWVVAPKIKMMMMMMMMMMIMGFVHPQV